MNTDRAVAMVSVAALLLVLCQDALPKQTKEELRAVRHQREAKFEGCISQCRDSCLVAVR